MLTIDNCTHPVEAWVLVHSFIRDILPPVSKAIKIGQKDLPLKAEIARRILVERLGRIAERMERKGLSDDREEIWSIRALIRKSNLAFPAAIEAVHQASCDLSEQARARRKPKLLAHSNEA